MRRECLISDAFFLSGFDKGFFFTNFRRFVDGMRNIFSAHVLVFESLLTQISLLGKSLEGAAREGWFGTGCRHADRLIR